MPATNQIIAKPAEPCSGGGVMAATTLTTALAVIEPSCTLTDELTPCIDMDSEALGVFVRDGMLGVAQKLVTLKPYIEEL